MDIFSSILQTVGLSTNAISNVHIEGHDPILPTSFLIGEAGAAALAAVGYAASEIWYLKKHHRQQISINVRNAAIIQRSHDYLRVINGETPQLWSPISGFYQTRDNRWIQLHCNFPNHRQGVVEFLNCADNKEAITAAVKTWNAETLTDQLNQKGLCAAMVRTPAEWQAHPQAQAIAQLPLMEIIKIGESNPEKLPAGDRPLSGIKVLDLTRVIAGPVCGKTLAEQDATVLRIASPTLPFILPLVMDTGFGKYSAYLNVDKPAEKQQLVNLIKEADVFLQAYRPGGLAQRGFSPEDLAQIRPGIIYVDFTAYSHKGPWANFHGYDSLVQSATGIVYAQSQGLEPPKHLPAQSLDYISGFLAAFGAMIALQKRTIEGGSYVVRVSLAQTAHWLTQLGKVTGDYTQCKIPSREQIKDLLMRSHTAFGELEHLKPVLQMSETPPFYSRVSTPLGSDAARWPT